MPPNLEESREKRILKREFVEHKLKKKKRHKLAVAKVEQNLEKTLAQAPVQVSKVHIDGLSTTKGEVFSKNSSNQSILTE